MLFARWSLVHHEPITRPVQSLTSMHREKARNLSFNFGFLPWFPFLKPFGPFPIQVPEVLTPPGDGSFKNVLRPGISFSLSPVHPGIREARVEGGKVLFFSARRGSSTGLESS
jgi:hypothetical protein